MRDIEEEDATGQSLVLPPSLRLLKALVTVLTAVMIVGMIAVVTVLVIRLQAPAVVLVPDALVLPEGTVARAITRGDGWWAVVTQDARILIFDSGGSLRQDIPIAPVPPTE